MAQAHDRLSDAVSMEALVRHQLILLGEDPAREGLRDTPARVKESLEFLTRGYRMTVDDVFGDATFAEGRALFRVTAPDTPGTYELKVLITGDGSTAAGHLRVRVASAP